MLGTMIGAGAIAKETILMPRLVLVVAGINKLVLLSAAGIAILLGWFAPHPAVVSWVPVE